MVADVFGSRMLLDPREFVDRSLLFGPQFYDSVERRFLRKHLRPGDVFADVGAHIGYYSLLAARIVGAHGRVLAFEADPVNHSRLVAHLEMNGSSNVVAVHAGVADQPGVLSLGINDRGNRGGNSFLVARPTSIPVRCETLHSLLAAQGVRTLAGMKLDIEGFEYRVLHRFFDEAPTGEYPGFVIVESNPTLVEEAGGDAVQLLIERGYRVRHVTDLNYVLTLSRC